ncbi:MAG: hypothetical protein AAGJ35_06400, partial [Myxococcota bacterium]
VGSCILPVSLPLAQAKTSSAVSAPSKTTSSAQSLASFREVAKLLSKQHTFAVLRLSFLDALLQNVFEQVRKIQFKRSSERMAVQMIQMVLKQVQNTGIDLKRGMVMAGFRSPFSVLPPKIASKAPLHGALWLWLTREDALSSILSLLNLPKDKIQSAKTQNAELFLIRPGSIREPYLVILREGKRVLLTLGKPVLPNPNARSSWFRVPLSQMEQQMKAIQSMVSPKVDHLLTDQSFRHAVKQHAHEQVFALLRFAPMLDMVPQLPAPLQKILVRLKQTIHSYAASGNYHPRLYQLHEHFQFGQRGNPFFTFVQPQGPQIAWTSVLPADADLIGAGQIHLVDLWKKLYALGHRFAPARMRKRAERFLVLMQQQSLVLLGSDLGKSIFSQLNGQMAAFFRFDNQGRLPVLETMQGAGIAWGIKDPKAFAKTIEALFSVATDKMLVRAKKHRVPESSTPLYEIMIAKDSSLFLALSEQVLLLTADRAQMVSWLRQQDSRVRWKARLKSMPHVFQALDQGEYAMWADFRRLYFGAIAMALRFQPSAEKELRPLLDLAKDWWATALVGVHSSHAWRAEWSTVSVPPGAPVAVLPKFPPFAKKLLQRKRNQWLRRLPVFAGALFFGVVVPMLSSPLYSSLIGLGGSVVAIPAWLRYQQRSRAYRKKYKRKP